jgi:hypothetical protein
MSLVCIAILNLRLGLAMHFSEADGNAQATLDTSDTEDDHMWSDSRISDKTSSELLSWIAPFTTSLKDKLTL